MKINIVILDLPLFWAVCGHFPTAYRSSSVDILLFYFSGCDWGVVVNLLSEWFKIVHFTLIIINMVQAVISILVLFAEILLNIWVFDGDGDGGKTGNVLEMLPEWPNTNAVLFFIISFLIIFQYKSAVVIFSSGIIWYNERNHQSMSSLKNRLIYLCVAITTFY